MDDASADRGAGTLGRRRFLALAAGAVAGSAAPRRAAALERPVRGGVLTPRAINTVQPSSELYS